MSKKCIAFIEHCRRQRARHRRTLKTTRCDDCSYATPPIIIEAFDRANHVDGYCNIEGRINDMVIRGGESNYPREIEEFLYRHPSIQEVQIFGVPGLRYGEELCAWIKLRAGEERTEADVGAFCDGQIAHYKAPRIIRFVADFPMTVTGKFQKLSMRDTMIRELGIPDTKTT